MKENNIQTLVRKYWMIVLIAAQPLLDVLAFWTASESGTAAGVIRLLCMVAVVFTVLLKRRSKGFFFAMAVVATVFALHTVNGFRVGYMNLRADILYISKVVYMPVMAICFCCLYGDGENGTIENQILKGIMISAGLTGLVIVLSAVTNTYTYTYTIEKLGISGWVIDSNRCCHSDILSTLAVFTAYFAVKDGKTWVRVLLPPLLFAALITNGTTACFLTLLAIMAGFPLFTIFLGFLRKEKIEKATRIVLLEMAALFVLTIAVYPITPRYKMEELERNSYNDNEERFAREIADLGYDIYSLSLEEKLSIPEVHKRLTVYYIRFIDSTVETLRQKYDVDRVIRGLNGTVSAKVLGDTRNMKRLNARFIFEDSDTLTRVFGFEFGHMKNDFEDLENDWFAIFYYYGYFGFAVYILAALFLYGRILLLLIREYRRALTVRNFTLLMCYTLQLGLAYFSGAMMRRPNASIYLALVVAMVWHATCPAAERKAP